MVEVFYQVIGKKILIMFMNTVIMERGYSVQRTFNNISVKS